MTETTAPKYLAQSECNAWAGCGFAAFARYVAEYRPGHEETRPQRIGSIGHAMLAEEVRAACAGRAPDFAAAVERERDIRRWEQVLEDELECARGGYELASGYMRPLWHRPVPDLWGGSGGPLADVVVRVPWDMLLKAYDGLGLTHAQKSLSRMGALRRRFAGIEGHPDLVTYSSDGAGVVIVDYKFRQRSDLGGFSDEVSDVPDRQFAYYAVLLYAAGLRPAGGFELLQLNAYAGRFATVEDFVRVSQGNLRTEEEAELITNTGLPTRDSHRLDKAGYAVTPEVWGEAHRVLANARHARRLASGQKPRELLSAAEEAGARSFLEDLARRPLVRVRRMRHNIHVCLEVVHGMLAGTEAHLALLDAEHQPPRNLQSHPSSHCMKPGGCNVRGICLSTLGTYGGPEAAREAAMKLPVYDG